MVSILWMRSRFLKVKSFTNHHRGSKGKSWDSNLSHLKHGPLALSDLAKWLSIESCKDQVPSLHWLYFNLPKFNWQSSFQDNIDYFFPNRLVHTWIHGGWLWTADKNKSIITSLSGSQLAFTLEGLGSWADVVLKSPLSPAQYPSKGIERNHQETFICMALSYLEIVEENLHLGINTYLQSQFKNICSTVKQLLFLLPLPNDYV